ncbi:MAG: ABC transporter ATP-binding protein [Micropruina sp.]|nr:ABC transporter ATP-binding protein [Micropruina sp.]
MSVPAAQFVNITQTFGDLVAVDDISLDIEHGKLTTLLGPSGCGKTTSLRMLAGFSKPTSGSIFIEGEDCTGLPPEKRGLGMVFQQYALFPHMSVRDNVAYGLKLRKVPAAERKRRADEALELVGLTAHATKRPRKMSGGQQQRVALARAIAIRPRLLLLDEPLSALDARLRVEMRAELRRIQAETGLCVVLVTHDQDEALELSDRMVVMRAGKIEQAGTPQEVFGAPATRFIAEFMGSRISSRWPTAPRPRCVRSGWWSPIPPWPARTSWPDRGCGCRPPWPTSPTGASTCWSPPRPPTRPDAPPA